MLPQESAKDNKPNGGVIDLRAGHTRSVSDQEDREVPERAVRGFVTVWLRAKTMPIVMRVLSWLAFLLIAVAGGALAWWRARRAVIKGALDADPDMRSESPPSGVVREHGLYAWIKGEGEARGATRR
jgi:hypothetical protein